ncbi:MAG: ComEC/Rec2 family competence protein, partial [Firmicutes bacterium]|nr:ComEC/Rec2 family competence protein [Bacillota bacterium]
MKEIKTERKRIINFRAYFTVALFLLCAVFAALVTTVYAWLGAALIILVLSLAVGLAVYYKKDALKKLTFIVCAAVCALAFTAFLVTNAVWVADLDYNKEMSIIGTVETDVSVDGTRKIYLKNVSLNGDGVSGRLLLYIKDGDGGGEGFKSGTIVSLNHCVSPMYLTDGFTVYGSAFRNNTHYAATIESAQITQRGERDPGVFIKIREFIYGKLVNAMGDEYGALCYGMITGDKSHLDLATFNYFSAAGLCHILAVSGLHLGVLIAFLTFVLKKLRVGHWATAGIILGALLFYTFVAGFSPSVLRAAAMSTVGLLVFLFGRRRDMLSSLCFAFCLIVTVAPFFLFEAGFVLSISAVFGLALFYSPFFKGLQKIRFPKIAARFVALSASIQLGLIPAVIFFFSNVQPYAFIVNVFMLPIVTLDFLLTLLGLVLNSIIPPASFMLRPSVWGFQALDLVAQGVAKLPFSRFIIYS